MIADSLGRAVSTLKCDLYHCSTRIFPGTELDLQVLVKLLRVRLCSRQGLQTDLVKSVGLLITMKRGQPDLVAQMWM